MLQVVVGNLVYELGALEYQAPSVYFPLPAIIGIIAGGSVLILIIIVILIVCRRRSTLAERQYKKMKAQLDALESNVRNECKQGASRESSLSRDVRQKTLCQDQEEPWRQTGGQYSRVWGPQILTPVLNAHIFHTCKAESKPWNLEETISVTSVRVVLIACLLPAAFAELQTEVSDVTSDLGMTGIPIWDYKQYSFKVLFPSHQDHPVLHTTMDVSTT